MKEVLLGFGVDSLDVDEVCTDIFEHVVSKKGGKSDFRWLACLNPHSYVVALDDSDFNEALQSADWLIPDGAGIVLASRFVGECIGERVTGSDIFWGLHARMESTGGGRVFFLGSTDAVLEKIKRRMESDYPHVKVVGSYSPPFGTSYSEDQVEDMIDAINRSKSDVLWVGLTAPKQEKWIFSNRHRLNVRFAAGVGAVFDFYAGTVQRSDPLFQRIGLEWLPRLVRQPRKLWRRTFVSAPIFIWHVLKAKFTSKG